MTKLSVHQEARDLYVQRVPAEMAATAGGLYIPEEKTVEISYLGFTCRVDHMGVVTIKNAKTKLTRNETTLILQYLTNSSGINPRGRWVSFLQLPDGPHHHIPFKLEAIDPLAQTFGDNREAFVERAAALGGRRTEMGDLGMVFDVFPKLPMAMVVWAGDDEFPPQANILFDANAPLHLTTAQLWVLGVQLVGRMTNESRIDYL